MRNLTIKREKATVGMFSTLKIYIEDNYIPELYINGVPCRKIGTVKNGMTETFKIPEKAARVFAIWDKGTRNVCNDCYELPEGVDVFLLGRSTFDPLMCNPFKFEGNKNVEGARLRNKALRKTLIILFVILALIFTVAGLASAGVFNSLVDPNRPIYSDTPEWNADASDKSFKVDDFEVVLSENFTPTTGDGFVAVFESSRVTLFLVRETFENYPEFEELTREEYLQKLIDANKDKIQSYEVLNSDGLYGFRSTRLGAMNEEYTVYSYIYKTDTAFWFVQFKALSEKVAEHESDILKWARSITFGDPIQ